MCFVQHWCMQQKVLHLNVKNIGQNMGGRSAVMHCLTVKKKYMQLCSWARDQYICLSLHMGLDAKKTCFSAIETSCKNAISLAISLHNDTFYKSE